jgi:hypothetical protein
MAFDVAPAPIHGRRSRGPVIALVIAAIGIVAAGVLTAGPAVPVGPVRSGVVAEPSVPIARGSALPPTVSTAVPLRLPARVECHDLAASTCDRLAQATMAILSSAGPRVLAIDAWASLLCGDANDCPPAQLARAVPLGSTVVSFAGAGSRAWVNIVEPIPPAGREWVPIPPVAWVIRWLP